MILWDLGTYCESIVCALNPHLVFGIVPTLARIHGSTNPGIEM
jgi:hypothetical protein